jgi:hypothetical protein
MGTRIIPGIALSAAISFGLLCAIGMGTATTAPAPPSEACMRAMNNATVDDAFKVGAQGAAKPGQAVPTVWLGDTIGVKITGLAELQSACTGQPIVLYLNDYPIRSLKIFPAVGELHFALNVTDDSRAWWIPILGRPCCSARVLRVSAGIEDQNALRPAAGKSLPELKLNIIGNGWFVIWAAIFAVMIVGFFWCVRRTNIIRDGNPVTPAAGVAGTYSLSKSQGAYWFFIIVAAYLLIGMVTGDFSNSINDTALILLGIGAGTVIGSAVIDASKETQDGRKTSDAIAETESKLSQIRQGLAALDVQINAQLAPPNVEELKKQRSDKESERTQALSEYRKLTRQSEQYLTDILSDANGVSFHRFQMAAWTLVLGLVFIKEVYENLAMPEFNTTLMGLLGLSAGTYLGLKIPEATTPKK